MALDARGLQSAVLSHCLSLGVFDRVNGHEPESVPGTGITAACWFGPLRPAAGASGLNTTSAVIIMRVRLYQPATMRPADAIDVNLLAALDTLIASLSADFTLGGTVRNIDIFGAYGGGQLAGEDVWLEMPDGAKMRGYDLSIPCVINDVWTQAE